jgi:hypothetical protein
MLNIKTSVKGKILTITVDLSKEHGTSGSGKSTIIASTQGNQLIEGTKDIKFGLNIYKKVGKE